MNEVTYTAILLKATDYRDYDRRVRLLTLEGGAVGAVFKGVKRPDAKLKFGAQPFAFCQYTLAAGKGGYYTVTGCAPLGDFYPIAIDPDKYIVGSLLLEVADIASYGQPSSDLFLLLLGCLKQLAYSAVLPNVVAAHFLCRTTDLLGYTADYAFTGNFAPTNLSDASAALQVCETENLERISVSPQLALRAAKLQAGRFSSRVDAVIRSAKLLQL